MRTKIGKRIGPVPIVAVAALALAAFLSVGLLTLTPTTPNGVPAAEAQGFDGTGSALNSTKCQVMVAFNNTGDDIGGITDATKSGGVIDGPCNTTADQLKVSVYRNAGANAAKRGARVYVTGGSQFPKVWASATPITSGDNRTGRAVTPTDRRGKMGVDQHELDFAAVTFSKRQEHELTVTRSMADSKGEVFLFIYDPASDSDNSGLVASSTSLAGDADISIRVKFVGKPVFGTDGCDSNKIVDSTTNEETSTSGNTCEAQADDVDEERSLVVATSNGTVVTDTNNDGKTASHPELVLANDDNTQVTITATVKDAGNNPLKGAVTFTVTSNPTGIASATRIRDTGTSGENAGKAEYAVVGLPIDQAFRVEVAVMFKGETGNLDMGMVIITRSGDPTTIVADTYNVMCLDDKNDTATANNLLDDTFDMEADDDCAAVDRFPRKGMFIVKAHLQDALGNPVDGNLSIDLEDMDKPLDTDNDGDTVVAPDLKPHPDESNVWLYTVDKDAALGEHDITLSSTAKDVADVVLPVTIAGQPSKYTVEPMSTYIALRDRGTFTVTALDTNDNIPALVADDPATTSKDEGNNTVQIDATYGDVRGAKVDGNDVLTLDLNTGKGTFTYTLPRDARQGETFRIYVGTGAMQVEVMVTAGMMVTVPAVPTNVSATATSHTAITVRWDDVDGVTYKVERGTSMDPVDPSWMTIAAEVIGTFYMDSGLTANTTYYYRVTAMNSAGMSASAMTSETTQMAPSMDPMAPTGLDTTLLLGNISVTWDPDTAQNASQIIVVLFNEEITALARIGAPVATFNPAADPGAHTFNNVRAGTYKVAIAAVGTVDGEVKRGFAYSGVITVP